MRQNTQWYEVENPKDSHCTLSAGLNELYSNSFSNHLFRLPTSLGEGYWRRDRINSEMEVVICNMRLNQILSMESIEQDDSLKLCFCIGKGLQWTVNNNLEEYHINTGEVVAFGRTQTNSLGHFEPEEQFHSITLKLNLNKFLPFSKDQTINTLLYEVLNKNLYYNSKITPKMKRILHEIIHCNYQKEVRHIYIEGKLLELVAVYIEESILETGKIESEIALSKSDIASLQQAKQIVEGNLVNPPSISELSKLVYLNETKLKKGFKLLFGMPVYSYIIDRRLETAYLLLQEGKMNITNAALMVGFSKASHFTEKFKKKYGLKPSEYFY